MLETERGKGDITHLLALDGLRDITGSDQLCEALCYGSLTHTRLTDEARVVLGSSAKNLGHALDLLGASNNGVKLALQSDMDVCGDTECTGQWAYFCSHKPCLSSVFENAWEAASTTIQCMKFIGRG